MKLKMDLLPSKYKCMRRDYLGIALAGASAVIAVVVLSMTFISKSFEYSRARSEAESPLIALQQQIKSLDDEIDMIQRRAGSVAFDPVLKYQLVKEINQFNQIRMGFQWSHFFQIMEVATPSQVWVKDFDFSPRPNDTMYFTLYCEAADGMIPIRFYQNLLQGPVSSSYRDVMLGENRFSNKTLTIHFTMSFVVLPKGAGKGAKS